MRTCSIDGCKGRHQAHGWCMRHYGRWREYGDPMRERPTRIERFWSKVDRSAGDDACWEWTACRNAAGYGSFPIATGKTQLAHRFIYSTVIGSIPEGHGVLHRCDNPPCVNPAHLFTGTAADNCADKIRKGREWHIRGEAVSLARLTADDVATIRKRYAVGGVSQESLAAEFGVIQATISKVVRRDTWRHVS